MMGAYVEHPTYTQLWQPPVGSWKNRGCSYVSNPIRKDCLSAQEQLAALVIEIIGEKFGKRNASDVNVKFTDGVKIELTPERDLNT